MSAGTSRVIPRVSPTRLESRNDSGVENPGWPKGHNTPALILTDGCEFLHLRVRRRRRLFLRFVPTERSTSLRVGGPTEFLGQPERGQSRSALRDPGEVGMRIHPAGSV